MEIGQCLPQFVSDNKLILGVWVREIILEAGNIVLSGIINTCISYLLSAQMTSQSSINKTSFRAGRGGESDRKFVGWSRLILTLQELLLSG